MSFPKKEGTMSTAVVNLPTRIPPKGMTEGVFVERIQKILPLLYKVAATISRPKHIDDDDLVQEACMHLFRNRHNFDGSIATLNTWCVTVARRRFLNIAKRSYGSTRYPKNINGELARFVSLSGVAEITPSNDISPYDKIKFEQSLDRVKKRLPKFARQIFMLYIEMPDDFLQYLEKVGATDNGSIHFITNQHLVDYLGSSYGKILAAKRKIKEAINESIGHE